MSRAASITISRPEAGDETISDGEPCRLDRDIGWIGSDSSIRSISGQRIESDRSIFSGDRVGHLARRGDEAAGSASRLLSPTVSVVPGQFVSGRDGIRSSSGEPGNRDGELPGEGRRDHSIFPTSFADQAGDRRPALPGDSAIAGQPIPTRTGRPLRGPEPQPPEAWKLAGPVCFREIVRPDLPSVRVRRSRQTRRCSWDQNLSLVAVPAPRPDRRQHIARAAPAAAAAARAVAVTAILDPTVAPGERLSGSGCDLDDQDHFQNGGMKFVRSDRPKPRRRLPADFVPIMIAPAPASPP